MERKYLINNLYDIGSNVKTGDDVAIKLVGIFDIKISQSNSKNNLKR